MDWLPNSINAIVNMLHEAGVMGTIAFVFTFTLCLLLHKHLGGVLEMARRFMNQRLTADVHIITKLTEISESNQEISERVNKLPSESRECRAKSTEEIIAILKEHFGESSLSDNEVAMLVKHRQDIQEKTKGT